MKSTSKSRNRSYQQIQQDIQAKQKRDIVLFGVLFGLLLTVVVSVAFYGETGAEDISEPAASGFEIVTDDTESSVKVHPLKRYATGRTIEEIDRLIEDSSTSK